MKTGDLLKGNDICEIINPDLEKDGFPLGTRVLVAGTTSLPIDKKDLYLQRVYVFVNKLLLDEKTYEKQLCVIDPRSLKRVGNKEKLEIENWLAPKETNEATN